jgi:hypothetical protein
MAQVRFCSKCGGSLFESEDRCRLCRTPLEAMTYVAAPAAERTAQFDASPFVGVWLSPRNTVRGILDSDPKYLVLPLAAIGGIFQSLNRLMDRNAADMISLPILLLLAVTAGPIGGILGLHIGAALIHFTGKWIGGTGSKEEIRAAIAWGGVPALWGGLLWIPILLLGGSAAFSSDLEAAEINAIALLLTGGMLLVQAATAIWSIFTGLHALGEAQGFSAWKAFGNGLLAGLVVIVPIVVIGFGLAFFLASRI